MARKITKTKTATPKKRTTAKATKAAVKPTVKVSKPVGTPREAKVAIKPVAATKTKPAAYVRKRDWSTDALKVHLADHFSASKPHRDAARPLRRLAANHGIDVGTCSAGASADKWAEHVADLRRALQRKGISLE